MKLLISAIVLSSSLIFVVPGWTEESDYKKMISEFENFRSGYQQDPLLNQPGQLEAKSDSLNYNADLDELQNRWNQLVEKIDKSSKNNLW